MIDQGRKQRQRLVLVAARRLLDVSDDAPLDELKTAVGALGIDVDAAIADVESLVKEYPKRLMEEAKLRQQAERMAFERFQQQLAAVDVTTLQEQVRFRIDSLPRELSAQMHAYHRELSAKTGEDVKSELVDLLWQLSKNAKNE